MKTFKKLSVIISMLFFIVTVTKSTAQENSKTVDTVKIKTSAQCEHCKETIENALNKVKGVKKALLNVKSKVVEVVYRSDKTNPDELRQTINNVGYDADDKAANNKSYQKLKECCKKEGNH